ncbi:lectin-like domain-containing protein [Thermococcus eurythermalis]|uniref:lectin-like domain-containing protein n=1 Tax=Thermococcus eurythermalis TaxID=1505907 RepID=UPI000A51E989|nr:protein kinase [Thermococcus eurythermalis]
MSIRKNALNEKVGIIMVLLVLTAVLSPLQVIASEASQEITGTHYDQWHYVGTAQYDPTTGGIILTPASASCAGAAWFNSRVSLTDSFDFTFLVYLGDDDTGADGIAFVLQATGTDVVGGTGGDVGYIGIGPSVAVKIDTWGDSEDYIVLMINGTEVGDKTYIGNIEDSREHLMRISWDPYSETLHVQLDGISVTYNVNILKNPGILTAYFGWTGGTGLSYNLQYFKVVSMTGLFPDPLARNIFPPEDWKLNGDASIAGDKFILTKSQANSVGAVWFKQPLDLSEDFTMRFRVYISNNAGDGMAFVLQSYGLDAVGAWGFNQGYVPISPSVAVKIDADYAFDVHRGYYAVLMVNGIEITDPVPIAIKDNKEHNMEISWGSYSKTLSVYYDDKKIISERVNLVKILDSPTAYFGFTGATGGGDVHQYVKQVDLRFSEGTYVKKHSFVDPMDWQYWGTAEYKPEYDAIKIGKYTTSAEGSVWYKNPLDFRKPFNLTFLIGADFYEDRRSRLLAFVFTQDPGNTDPWSGFVVKFYPGNMGTTYVELDWKKQELYKSTIQGMYSGVMADVTFSWNPSTRSFRVTANGNPVADFKLPDTTVAYYLNRPVYFGFMKNRDWGAMLIKPIKLDFETFNTTAFSENWNLVGDAKYMMGNFVLTEDREYQRGAVWYTNPIDITKPFSVETSVYLGSNDRGGSGLAVVIQAQSNNVVGLDGGNVGYVPISPSVAVKIDTYDNSISSDYIVLMVNGREIPETIRPIDNVEDSQEHHLIVSYDGETMRVILDGDKLIDYPINLETVLGSTSAYVGATAGTSSIHNTQYIRFVEINAAPSNSTPQMQGASLYNNLTYDGSAFYDPDADLIILGKYSQEGSVWFSNPISLNGKLQFDLLVKPPYGNIAVILQRGGTNVDLDRVFKGEIYPSIVIGIRTDQNSGSKITIVQNGNKLYEKTLSIKNVWSAISLGIGWDNQTSTLTLSIDETTIPIKLSSDPVDIWTGDFYLGVGAKINGDVAAVKFLNVSYTPGNLEEAASEWIPLGNSEIRSSGEILLVPGISSKGAVWLRTPVNLSMDFVGKFLLRGKSSRADVISIVFQNTGPSLFSNEPNTVHIDFNYGSQEINLYNNKTKLFRGGLPSVNDGKMHTLTVGWNASLGELWLEIDGSRIFTQKVDMKNLLGETAYVGFYASNGCCANEKYVVPLSVKQMEPAVLLSKTPDAPQGSPSDSQTEVLATTSPTHTASAGSNLNPVTLAGALVGLILAGGIVARVRSRKGKPSASSRVAENPASKVARPSLPPEKPTSAKKPESMKYQKTFPGFPSELLDEYEPLEFLGEGGFARVFKARRRRDGKIVALKIPRIDEKTSKTFIKEVSTWLHLNHPNIVKLYDADILPIPHLEIEFVEGINLNGDVIRDLSKYPKPVDEKTALKIIEGIAKGLKHAHSKGIYHRDLKPQNVLITSNLTPKITDWGLAKVGDISTTTTRGLTPLYAAPEQFDEEVYGPTDHRTDIYQLGLIFYELLTGKLPYQGASPAAVMAKATNQDIKPLPPSHFNKALSKYDGIFEKLLTKRKEDRYQSVDEFLSALKSLRELKREKKELEKTSLAMRKSHSREEFERLRIESIHKTVKIAILAAKSNDKVELINALEDLKELSRRHRKELENAINQLEIMMRDGVPIKEGTINELRVLLHRIQKEVEKRR